MGKREYPSRKNRDRTEWMREAARFIRGGMKLLQSAARFIRNKLETLTDAARESGGEDGLWRRIPWRRLSLPGKILASLVCLGLLYIFFCRLSWASIMKYTAVQQLRDNLDALGAVIDRYPWLAAAAVVLIPLFLLIGRFSLNTTTFTILGLEMQFRQTESAVKAQIKNFLSAKRAIFVFYEEYDNYYDCINSMYRTLVFLQEQLENFERFSQTNTDIYEHIEGIIQEIGRFLTKYQSDYRRYYETEIANLGDGSGFFTSFHDIQDRYPKNREMAEDFYRLNENLAVHAKFFDIDIDKWKWDEWEDRSGVDARNPAEAEESKNRDNPENWDEPVPEDMEPPEAPEWREAVEEGAVPEWREAVEESAAPEWREAVEESAAPEWRETVEESAVPEWRETMEESAVPEWEHTAV